MDSFLLGSSICTNESTELADHKKFCEPADLVVRDKRLLAAVIRNPTLSRLSKWVF